jgi:site-specific recombinase XerD
MPGLYVINIGIAVSCIPVPCQVPICHYIYGGLKIASSIKDLNTEMTVLNLKNETVTPQKLINTLKADAVENQTVIQFIYQLVNDMNVSKHLGNAKAYKYLGNQLKRFLGAKDIEFTALNFTFLSKYEVYLRSKNVSENTLSIQFRTLRAVYNLAIKHKIVSKSDYPFEDFKISKFNTDTTPRAITKSEIKIIEALNISPESFLFDARNFFLFSFYGCGINFVDMARLKWGNIDGSRIDYVRSKTGKTISFKLIERSLNILDYYHTVSGGLKTNYIFPVLNREVHKTIQQQDWRERKMLKRVNKALKEIGELAGLEKKLTTYVARHSFASVLKHEGINVSVISELMDHSSERTTRIYLTKLGDNIKDDAINSLI